MLFRSNKLYQSGSANLLSSYTNSDSDYILLNDGINANSSNTYEFRMWIDYTITDSDISSSDVVNAKVFATGTIKTQEPQGWSNSEEGTLLYALRTSNSLSSPSSLSSSFSDDVFFLQFNNLFSSILLLIRELGSVTIRIIPYMS